MKRFTFYIVFVLSVVCAYSTSENSCRSINPILFAVFRGYASSNNIEVSTVCKAWIKTQRFDKMAAELLTALPDNDAASDTNLLNKSLLQTIKSKLPLDITSTRSLYQANRKNICKNATVVHFLIYLYVLERVDFTTKTTSDLIELCDELTVHNYNRLNSVLSADGFQVDDVLKYLFTILMENGYSELARGLIKLFAKSGDGTDDSELSLAHLELSPTFPHRQKYSLMTDTFLAPDLPPIPRSPLITGYDVPDMDDSSGGEGWMGSRRYSSVFKNASWNKPKKIESRKYLGTWTENKPQVEYEKQFMPFGPKPSGVKYYRRISEREAALEEKKNKLKEHQEEMKVKHRKMWKSTAGYRDLKGESFDEHEENTDDIGPSPIDESSVLSSSSSSSTDDDSDDSSESSESSSTSEDTPHYKEPKFKRRESTITDIDEMEQTPVQEKLPELTKADAIKSIQKTCRYLTKSQKSRALALYKLLAWLSEGVTNGWEVKPFCFAVYYSEKQLYVKPSSELPKHMAKICVRELRYVPWVVNDPELIKNIPKVCYGFYKRIAEHFRKSKL